MTNTTLFIFSVNSKGERFDRSLSGVGLSEIIQKG